MDSASPAKICKTRELNKWYFSISEKLNDFFIKLHQDGKQSGRC